MQENLNICCPEETIKLGSQDKPWVNKELKKIHRLRSREYTRNGHSVKYKSLVKEFETKYKAAAQRYLSRNTNELKQTNPGHAYRILKKMGAQPGDCMDSNTFTLPSHQADNLTNQESAERIAEHFSAISQEFLPLNINKLAGRVQLKLKTSSSAPVVSVEDTLEKINAAKKTQVRGPWGHAKFNHKRIF